MRVLLVDTWIHHKNTKGMKLMCDSVRAELVITKNQDHFGEEWDLVYVPAEVIPSYAFPNAKKIIYGPHNFVFPHEPWITPSNLFDSRCSYNLLSEWVMNAMREVSGICMPIVTYPFGVDIERFKPDRNTTIKYDCFIYYKQRKSTLLQSIIKYVEDMNLTYIVIRYGHYDEDEYIKTVRQSNFGIWCGIHESQGFALQEALSMDKSLLVYDALTMFDGVNDKDEYNFQDKLRKYKLPATCCPYWDNTLCGIIVSNDNDFKMKLQQMKISYTDYKPREFILRTLTPSLCIQRMIQT